MTFDELIAQSIAPSKTAAFVTGYRETQTDGNVGEQDRLPMRTMAPMLPNVTLTEYHNEEKILYRIAGQDVVERLGFNPIGQNVLDLIAQEKRRAAVDLHDVIIRHPCGSYVLYESTFLSGRRARSESITFPMRKDAACEAALFLSYHVHHQPTGYSETSETTSLGQSHQQADLIDIGFGIPKIPI